MSAAALALRQTAIADIRRRGRSDHPYRTDLAIVVPLRLVDRRVLGQAADAVALELTAWERDTGRHGAARSTSARAGLADVLVLLAQGYREMSQYEIAAIAGVHRATAQRWLARLCDAGVFWRKQVGRKGECMTTYALGPRGAAMFDAALVKVKGWIAAKAKAAQRYAAARVKAARQRAKAESRTLRHRASPPPIGGTNSSDGADERPAAGSTRPAQDRAPGPRPVAEVLAAEGLSTRSSAAAATVVDAAADAELVAAYRAGAAERRAKAQTRAGRGARRLAAGFDKAFRGAAGAG